MAAFFSSQNDLLTGLRSLKDHLVEHKRLAPPSLPAVTELLARACLGAETLLIALVDVVIGLARCELLR